MASLELRALLPWKQPLARRRVAGNPESLFEHSVRKCVRVRECRAYVKVSIDKRCDEAGLPDRIQDRVTHKGCSIDELIVVRKALLGS